MAFLIGVWLAVTGISLFGLIALLIDEGHLRLRLPRIALGSLPAPRSVRAGGLGTSPGR